ncbi:hypothetical protein JTF08_11850 [Micrococcaceae bacterium RIT802]|nr:hypothetical protein [Micrococcaceae bacterium RIT 802]
MTKTSTMRLDLTGEMDAASTGVLGASDADLYSLFASRASALGWSVNPFAPTNDNVRWWMNDAAFGRTDTNLLADPWVQVDARAEFDRCLPIQELLTCLDMVLHRIGAFKLKRLDLLAPLQTEVPDHGALFEGLGWFDPHFAGNAVPVSVAVRLPSWTQNRPDQILDAIARLTSMQNVPFALDLLQARDGGPPSGLSRFTANQLGATRALRFPAVLPEWTTPAIAWFCSYLAHSLSALDQTSDVLLSIERT